MADPYEDKSMLLWRIAAGILCVVAVGIGLLRLLVIAVEGLPEGAASVGYILRVIFPLGIGLAFGYIAFSPRLWRRSDGQSHSDDQ